MSAGSGAVIGSESHEMRPSGRSQWGAIAAARGASSRAQPPSASANASEAAARAATPSPPAPFRRRLAVGAIVILTVVVGVSALLAWRQYDAQKKQALVELKARVVLASTVFDNYFAGQLGVLNSIAASRMLVRERNTGTGTS
mgnify:CR=1 FL=1